VAAYRRRKSINAPALQIHLDGAILGLLGLFPDGPAPFTASTVFFSHLSVPFTAFRRYPGLTFGVKLRWLPVWEKTAMTEFILDVTPVASCEAIDDYVAAYRITNT
jgi:hypothetical protein